ncbi:hypothetical protein HY477_04170 [Candidatus Uhrbacteria bacterium]|nr:hypothetical protein [Candidatus Uhrbacteria bacterium]
MPNPQQKDPVKPDPADVEAAFLEKLTPAAAAAGTLVREGRKQREAAAGFNDTEAARESVRGFLQDLRRGVMKSIVCMREHMTAQNQVAENMLKKAKYGLQLMRQTIGKDQVLTQEWNTFLTETEGELGLLESERKLHQPRSAASEEAGKQMAA